MLFNTLFVKESVKNDFINQKRGIYMNGERKRLFRDRECCFKEFHTF